MASYLLDSSAILDILKGGRLGFDLAHFINDGDVFASIITYCEVLNKADIKRQRDAKEFLSKFIILPLTVGDGKVAEEIQNTCRKNGKQVSTLDCLVAATAINHGAAVVTTDSDFERIEGVKRHVF